MQIEVEIHHKYGKPRFTPISDDAHFLLDLLDKKSFSPRHLYLCENRGWQVNILAPKINLKDLYVRQSYEAAE